MTNYIDDLSGAVGMLRDTVELAETLAAKVGKGALTPRDESMIAAAKYTADLLENRVIVAMKIADRRKAERERYARKRARSVTP